MSTKRNKTKTFLTIFFGIAFSMSLSILLVFNSSFSNTLNSLEQQIPLTITLRPESQRYEFMTLEIFEKLSNFKYVIASDFQFKSAAKTSLFNYYPLTINSTGSTYHSMFDEVNGFFWLNGTSSPNLLNVDYGLFYLDSGRMFTENEISEISLDGPTPILITKNVARKNGLFVEDIISLYDSRFSFNIPEYIHDYYFKYLNDLELWDHPFTNHFLSKYEFEIIGILGLDTNSATDFEDYYMQRVVYNTVFLPNWKIMQMLDDDRLSYIEFRSTLQQEIIHFNAWEHSVNAFWVVDNLNSLEYFHNFATPLLPSGYILEDWSSSFIPLKTALVNIDSTTQTFFVILICSSIMILVLFFLRQVIDKRKEIAIYLSLGAKKTDIIKQFVFEMISVFNLAMILGLSLGVLIGTEINNTLLRNELISEVTRFRDISLHNLNLGFHPSQIEFSGMGRYNSVDELLYLLNNSIDFTFLIVLFTIISLVLLISLIIPLLYILEITPKTLLEK